MWCGRARRIDRAGADASSSKLPKRNLPSARIFALFALTGPKEARTHTLAHACMPSKEGREHVCIHSATCAGQRSRRTPRSEQRENELGHAWAGLSRGTSSRLLFTRLRAGGVPALRQARATLRARDAGPAWPHSPRRERHHEYIVGRGFKWHVVL